VYARLSRKVCYLEDVEDLVQEVFVKAYTQLGQLKDGDRFAAWLRAIADNEARMWYRRRWVQLRLKETLEVQGMWEADARDDAAEMRRLQATVREALRTLTEAHRQVIVHHYFKGCTYLETADLLGLDVEVVRSRLQKARRRLREEIISMNGQKTQPQTFELGREELHFLRRAKAFASRDENRPILQGVCLDTSGRMVVTNGHALLLWTSERLAQIATQTILGPWFEMEVPEADRGMLSIGEKEAVIRIPGEKDRVAGIIPGRYVDYEQVIPKNGPIRATVGAGTLLKAVDLMADHLAPRHPTDPEGAYQYLSSAEIRLSGAAQTLSLITTREMGYSGPPDTQGKRQDCSEEEVLRLTGNTPFWTFTTSVQAQIETEGGTEEIFRIGVNPTYLREMAGALGFGPDEALELRFIDPLKAILVSPVRHADRKGLVMPLRMRKD
jgi:RNA polymerase sigma-70 factor (ECF subfamily)